MITTKEERLSRFDGYYKVKVNNRWTVSLWCGLYEEWNIVGRDKPMWKDEHLQEIGEMIQLP